MNLHTLHRRVTSGCQSTAVCIAACALLLQPLRARAQEASEDTKPGVDTKAEPHYDDGFVLLPSIDPVSQPFRLKLKHVSQVKYTNTLNVNDTYTDHFGTQHQVLKRHDIQLTREVFYFSGFAYHPKLDFNILIFFSSATLVATAAGYVGYRFHKAFALRAGYFSLPSTRAMTGTYPFFHGTDRPLATNYFRPGFTQGLWGEGEPLPGLRYIAMVGNSLNTLDILATHIDTKFAYSATVWYDRNAFGLPWNDYEDHDKVALRIGSAFTFAPEDRLSDLSTANPENNATFLSDGGLLFETGSLAPDVTVQRAHFYLLTGDIGLKYRGLAVNVEFFGRWLNDFVADGPLPVQSIAEWGFDASAGYFVLRHQLEVYLRSSLVVGSFKTPVEGSAGLNWYPFNTRQVWINLEAIAVKDAPTASGYYAYAVGQTGLLLQSQFLLRF
jgi:hypothetical protein